MARADQLAGRFLSTCESCLEWVGGPVNKNYPWSTYIFSPTILRRFLNGAGQLGDERPTLPDIRVPLSALGTRRKASAHG